MADVTYYVALPFVEDDSGAGRGRRGRMPEPATALRRAEMMSRSPAASARWPSAALAIP